MNFVNNDDLKIYQLENNSRQLEFFIDDSLSDCDIYIDFERCDGVKNKFLLNDNTFIIPKELIENEGYLKAQLVAYRDDSFVQKSMIIRLYVGESINATEYIVDTNPDAIEQLNNSKVDTAVYENGKLTLIANGKEACEPIEIGGIPVIKSMDGENPVILRDLASGIYSLQGYFKTYKGSDGTLIASNPVLTGVVKINSDYPSFIQIHYPVSNQIQYFEITDTEDKNINAYLNDIERKIDVAKFQNVIECALKYRIGKACTSINEVLNELNKVYSLAKIVVNATDSVTGEVLTNASATITSQTKWEDGYYYLETSSSDYSMIILCSGYSTQRVSFSVTSDDVKAGEKIINVAMVEVA